MGCGRPVIFFFFNAKPFIALGDVKPAGCLQQCHVTRGLPRRIHPAAQRSQGLTQVSAHPLSTSPAPARPQAGQRAAGVFYFFLGLWCRGFNYQSGFLFIE